MADTSVQRRVADWIVSKWAEPQFGAPCYKRKLALTCGGVYEFGLVCEDKGVVGTISTSKLALPNGKMGVGKVTKVRSDIYFLLLVEAKRRVVILTDTDMYHWWKTEQDERKRVPESIQFVTLNLPSELRDELESSRKRASDEVISH